MPGIGFALVSQLRAGRRRESRIGLASDNALVGRWRQARRAVLVDFNAMVIAGRFRVAHHALSARRRRRDIDIIR